MILVTGANGFVGRHVGKALLGADQEVLLMSRTARSGYAVADLCKDSLDELPWSRITSVIHCAAAIPGRADNFAKTNSEGTRRLLERLLTRNMRSFVLLSSVSIYVIDRQAVKVDLHEDTSAKSVEAYGRSKQEQEQLVTSFCQGHIPCAIFRPSSIFGKGNTSFTVLPVFCGRASRNEHITLKGPRRYCQNFVYVGDVSSLVVNAALGAVDGVFNVFSPNTLSLDQLARKIIHALESKSRVGDERTDDPYPCVEFHAERLNDRFSHTFVDFETAIQESC